MLSFQEVQNLLTGSVWGEEVDGWMRFYRLTKEQIEKTMLRGRSPRELATAGIRLDLDGDIEEISFDYKIKKGAYQSSYAIDCLQDRRRKFHLYENCYDTNGEREGHAVFRARNSNHLTVVFPSFNQMWIRNVEIKGTYTKHPHTMKLYFLGDSIMQGFDAAFPSSAYPNRLAVRYDAEILNQAVGGDRFNPMNICPVDFDPDAIFIAYGVNDWRLGDDIPKTADAFFRKLRSFYPEKPIFCISPVWCGVGPVQQGREDDLANVEGKKQVKTLDDARQEIRTAAEAYQVHYIEGRDFIPADPTLYAGNCVHPNDEGYAYMMQGIAAEIEKEMPELFQPVPIKYL